MLHRISGRGMICAVLLVLATVVPGLVALSPTPASAQFSIAPPDDVRCIQYIIHAVAPCWVIAPEYVTEEAPPGTFVALGLGALPGSTTLDVDAVDVVLAGQVDPLPELGVFDPNPVVADQFAQLRPDLVWQGFLAPVLAPLPAGLLLELHFHVNCNIAESSQLIIAETMASSFGSGTADPAGMPVGPGFAVRTPSDVVVLNEVVAAEPLVGLGPWLETPWPNPASSRVQFRFGSEAEGSMQLTVYDVRGRVVRRWDPRTVGQAGLLSWDMRDRRGAALGAGRYFLRLEQGEESVVRPFVLLR